MELDNFLTLSCLLALIAGVMAGVNVVLRGWRSINYVLFIASCFLMMFAGGVTSNSGNFWLDFGPMLGVYILFVSTTYFLAKRTGIDSGQLS